MQKYIGIVLTLSFQTCWEKEKKRKKRCHKQTKWVQDEWRWYDTKGQKKLKNDKCEGRKGLTNFYEEKLDKKSLWNLFFFRNDFEFEKFVYFYLDDSIFWRSTSLSFEHRVDARAHRHRHGLFAAENKIVKFVTIKK